MDATPPIMEACASAAFMGADASVVVRRLRAAQPAEAANRRVARSIVETG